jgi:hypothetical protein
MARCLELGERRWAGIVTMSAKKLGLEATLRPVGRPCEPTAKKTENMTPLFGQREYGMSPSVLGPVRGCWVVDLVLGKE